MPQFIVFGTTQINDEHRKAYLEEYKQRLLSINQNHPILYPVLAGFQLRFPN